jgi:hypothetical protein
MVYGGWQAEDDAGIQVEMLGGEALEFAAFDDPQPVVSGGEGLSAHDHAVACSGEKPESYPRLVGGHRLWTWLNIAARS